MPSPSARLRAGSGGGNQRQQCDEVGHVGKAYCPAVPFLSMAGPVAPAAASVETEGTRERPLQRRRVQ